jgi:hypothetical protein
MCLKKKCTSDVTSMEEERCRVFENGVLWRIFGRERAKGRGGWRTPCDEKLHVLCL